MFGEALRGTTAVCVKARSYDSCLYRNPVPGNRVQQLMPPSPDDADTGAWLLEV